LGTRGVSANRFQGFGVWGRRGFQPTGFRALGFGDAGGCQPTGFRAFGFRKSSQQQRSRPESNQTNSRSTRNSEGGAIAGSNSKPDFIPPSVLWYSDLPLTKRPPNLGHRPKRVQNYRTFDKPSTYRRRLIDRNESTLA
jgi:hypothetical protein